MAEPIRTPTDQRLAAAADPSMTSSGQLEAAIAASVPTIIAEAAEVGMSGIEAEAERFAKLAIENALSVLKVTPLARPD